MPNGPLRLFYNLLEIKTIENMQSAHKGEMTATAKYEAFSKKAVVLQFVNIEKHVAKIAE